MATKITSRVIAPGAVTANSLAESISLSGGGPKISNVAIANSTYGILDDTAVDISGGYLIITGTGFETGCQVIVGSNNAISTTFVDSTTIRAQVGAADAGTKTLYVVNTDGGTAIRVNGLTYSATPTWSTGSTLTESNVNEAISIQLSATSDSTVTYALQSGSVLPPGLSLSSGGLLSGTVTTISENTTYNFTVEATDTQFQNSPRTFSITINVIVQNNTAWYGGGSGISSVYRYDFNNDTAQATLRGPLSGGRYGIGSASNFDYGYFTGGFGGFSLRVDRITFSSDTGTTSIRGNLDTGRVSHSGVATQQYAWFTGGNPGSRPLSRITFSNDTGTSTSRSPGLNVDRHLAFATNNETDGWFVAGRSPSGPELSSSSRLTFSTDTTTTSARGNLTTARWGGTFSGNDNYGWFGGGRINPSLFSSVERITYVTDTSATSARGPLTAARYGQASSGNKEYGWYSGGNPGTNQIQRIQYSNDTVTASARSTLPVSSIDQRSGVSGKV
jgi:hypothetical protein